MHNIDQENQFDAIIIGSGTCGSTIARELTQHNKSVLVLERGGDVPLKENFRTIASIAEEVKLNDRGLAAMRAITAGGSTSLYFGVIVYPNLDTFRALGIDLSNELSAVKKEIPMGAVPEEMLGEKGKRLRDAATSLGYSWVTRDVMVDLSKCANGYSYEAKWKAKTYLQEAVTNGATLVTRANVQKILVADGRAIGVEYRTKKRLGASETHQAFGAKIILAAGELASPKILRDSGVKGVGDRGFICPPGHALYGLVSEMKGTESFMGSMGCDYDKGIYVGDANMSKKMHQLMMLGKFKLRHLRSYAECIGLGVGVHDNLGGSFKEDGSFHKEFDKEVHDRLRKGKQVALDILNGAGAKHIIDFGVVVSGRIGGLIRINDHLDSNLETEFRNLHVCDGSVIPEDMQWTPTVTLVCLGKYLSKHLLSRL